MHRNSQRGVALVITLLMLAIITVITVVFLATARRDSAATTLAGAATDAELAAEAGLRRALADITSQIMARSNLAGFEFTVSKNYDTNPLVNPAQVRDLRVPVEALNRFGVIESRHYYDMNRNGRHDPATNGSFGDPEWIALLDKLGQDYGPNNKALGRYSYVIVPAGKALDVNLIHNMASSNQTFYRSQGYGPWEMNLAAFLTDLDPNVWGYSYGPLSNPSQNLGAAFTNATDLLNYRYKTNVANLASVQALFGTNGVAAFTSDLIDGYSASLQTVGPIFPTTDADNPALPWAGAENPQHYFTPSDFFNVSKTSPSFVTNLNAAIANDPSVFYRMLAQLITDSGPDKSDKINLNYDTSFGQSATNFILYEAPALAAPLPGAAAQGSVRFFTNVAARLFQKQANEFNFPSILRIPIAPTNEYSASVHRILQVAANIYDARQNDRFPSVFRPIFETNLAPGLTNVYVVGYTNDNAVNTYAVWLAGNPHNIPMVIGAKKGFPNFNEFSMRQDMQLARKLQILRPATNAPPNQTNQMYLVGISNLFALENWNSYKTPYPYPLDLEVGNLATMTLTNQFGSTVVGGFAFGYSNTIPANTWIGSQFRLPVYQQKILLTNSAYRHYTGQFDPIGTNVFETGAGFPVPFWMLSVSNRLVYVMSEGGKIVDFVLLNNITAFTDVNKDLVGGNPYQGVGGSGPSVAITGVWSTNRTGGATSVFVPTDGIKNQMGISLGILNTSLADWNNYSQQNANGQDKAKAIDNLRRFVGLTPLVYTTNALTSDTKLEVQAGFTPVAKMVKTTTWQVNDPLVHYMLSDLTLYPTNSEMQRIVPPSSPVPTNTVLATLGALNGRYAPWGGNPNFNDPFSPTDPTAYTLTIKDPGVRRSDDWEFPSGKFASVGWLGRVHRGTPWQTIYLKPDIAGSSEWARQNLDPRVHPTNDWQMVDYFTTAVSDSSTRGLLSINQTNLASWSALFGGVVPLTNALPDNALGSTNLSAVLEPMLIPPAGIYTPGSPPALVTLWDAINKERALRPNGTFTKLSELIQIPELTTRSPFLNTAPKQLIFGLTDAAYERLPQQVLSLLKVGEARFVIYSYGQALKPKLIDPSSRLAVNYQITAEVATRTVVRLEGTAQRPRVVVESFNILPPD